MARRVRCQITKEYGTSDTFVKIGTKYYKSQEIYDKHHAEQKLQTQIVETIAYDFLGYEKGQEIPTVMFRKLKELDFYSKEVIIETLSEISDAVHYWMENKQFDSDFGRISYIFAIIKNKINDVYKVHKHKKEGRTKNKKQQELRHRLILKIQKPRRQEKISASG